MGHIIYVQDIKTRLTINWVIKPGKRHNDGGVTVAGLFSTIKRNQSCTGLKRVSYKAMKKQLLRDVVEPGIYSLDIKHAKQISTRLGRLLMEYKT